MQCTTLERSALYGALALAFTVACASTSMPAGALRLEQAASPRHRDETGVEARTQTLTDSELAATGEFSTTEAVRRLRPQFLRGSTRQPISGPPEIAVYLNMMYAGEVSTLSTIPLGEITRITFMHPTEARSHFGLMCRCGSGALLVSTRRATFTP